MSVRSKCVCVFVPRSQGTRVQRAEVRLDHESVGEAVLWDSWLEADWGWTAAVWPDAWLGSAPVAVAMSAAWH